MRDEPPAAAGSSDASAGGETGLASGRRPLSRGNGSGFVFHSDLVKARCERSARGSTEVPLTILRRHRSRDRNVVLARGRHRRSVQIRLPAPIGPCACRRRRSRAALFFARSTGPLAQSARHAVMRVVQLQQLTSSEPAECKKLRTGESTPTHPHIHFYPTHHAPPKHPPQPTTPPGEPTGCHPPNTQPIFPN